MAHACRYATGESESAKLFNCVQRCHQQALETYPQFLAMSLLAGLQFPITTALEGVVWIVARLAWSEGYATGKPENRYAYSPLGRHIWTPLLHLLVLNLFTAGKMMMP